MKSNLIVLEATVISLVTSVLALVVCVTGREHRRPLWDQPLHVLIPVSAGLFLLLVAAAWMGVQVVIGLRSLAHDESRRP
jgi:hypothetical protein